jgi:hypothetical protein
MSSWQVWDIISWVGLVLGAVFLTLAGILFFRYRIRSVMEFVSGRTAGRGIERIWQEDLSRSEGPVREQFDFFRRKAQEGVSSGPAGVRPYDTSGAPPSVVAARPKDETQLLSEKTELL